MNKPLYSLYLHSGTNNDISNVPSEIPFDFFIIDGHCM